jgi:ATP-dependent DNA helicase PIF1
MNLSPEQQKAFDLFLAGQNVFISGPGGSGKSHLIRFMFESVKSNKIQITSTTGCSSVLLANTIGIGRVKTIHSWSGVRLCKGDPEQIIANALKNKLAVDAWRKINILVIDEVSMLSKKIFHILESLGRLTRKSPLPFGGIQLVLLGDMYQLPPIPDAGDVESGLFCFEHPKWYDVIPIENHIALIRIFRQKDAKFQEILNQVRVGELTKENADILKSCIDRTTNFEDGFVPLKILPTRKQVCHINTTAYENLVEEEHVFEGHVVTDFKVYLEDGEKITADVLLSGLGLSAYTRDFEINVLKSNTPVEDVIKLKKGVPVMCLVNLDIERGVANGSLGVVVGFSPEGCVVVKFTNGVVRKIEKHIWQHQQYPNLCYSQIPLCLSYSSTIHKLQGSTLDLAEMNLGGSVFAEGQTYVGLSRVKSLEGLYLTAFHPNKIRVNQKAREFYSKFI